MSVEVPPIHPHEARRVARLRDFEIVGTPPEPAFDELSKLASFICGTPMSAVTLIDADRQWVKSAIGLDTGDSSRETAFCVHTILDTDICIVPDATRDRRFAQNPLVTGEPHIRFYAGAPLVTNDGMALGSLCVIDQRPRELTGEQLDALRALSRQAMAQLELRRRSLLLEDANRDLQALVRLKSDFVSMASHELRTPLTSIRGGLQLVLTDPEGPIDGSEARTLLEHTLASAERLVRMTNDILDVARLEAGRLDLRLARCDVRDLVESAVRAVEHVPGAAGRIRVSVEEGLPAIDADADRVVQALVNLIGNAVRHTRAPGAIEVNASMQRDGLHLAVRDEGAGLTPEEIRRLFQPFEQLGAAKRAGGTGLGLTITKGIVEQHGGVVRVTSRPGEGSVFAIVLPMVPSPRVRGEGPG